MVDTDNTFQNCYKLSSFTLNGAEFCKLGTSGVFSSTPYTGYSAYFSGTPYIYVPGYLLSSYQTATNWTYFSSYFSAIPGTDTAPLITFTIDGTEYQAEPGMTWGDWVESEYNVDNYYSASWSSSVKTEDRTKTVQGANYWNKITANKAYTTA